MVFVDARNDRPGVSLRLIDNFEVPSFEERPPDAKAVVDIRMQSLEYVTVCWQSHVLYTSWESSLSRLTRYCSTITGHFWTDKQIVLGLEDVGKPAQLTSHRNHLLCIGLINRRAISLAATSPAT